MRILFSFCRCKLLDVVDATTTQISHLVNKHQKLMMWEASLKDFVISDTVSLFKSYFTSLL